MYLHNQLESPAADLTGSGFGGLSPSYVTSPKVLELAEPNTAFRIAMGWLALVVASAVVLRLLMFALGPAAVAERALTDDAPLRAHLASQLLNVQTFGYDAADPAATSPGMRQSVINLRSSAGQLEAPQGALQPEVYEVPGYAIMLGLVDAAGGPTAWLLVIQCALSAVSAALVYGIVFNLLRKPVPALVAAAIVAAHPALVVAPLSLSDDVLFVTLLLLGLYGASRHTTPMAIVGGLALSAAVLVRPISIFVGPAIGLWMVLGDRKASTLGCAMTVAVMSVAGPAMWMARNHMVGFGTRLSSAPTAALAQTAAKVEASALGLPAPEGDTLPAMFLNGQQGDDVLASIHDTSLHTLKEHPLELGAVMSKTAMHLLTDHRVDALYHAMGLTYTPGGVADAFRGDKVIMPPQSAEARSVGYLSTGWLVLNVVLLLWAMLGLATMAGRRQGQLLLLVAAGLVYLVFQATGYGVAMWQPVALVFAAMACGAVFARSPRQFKVKKEKQPKKSRAEKRAEKVFDLEAEPAFVTPADQRPGLASRPI